MAQCTNSVFYKGMSIAIESVRAPRWTNERQFKSKNVCTHSIDFSIVAVRNISSWSRVIVQWPSRSVECPLPKFFASPADTNNGHKRCRLRKQKRKTGQATDNRYPAQDNRRAQGYTASPGARGNRTKRWLQTRTNAAPQQTLTDFDLKPFHDSEARFTLCHRHFAQTRCTSAANSSTTFHSKK